MKYICLMIIFIFGFYTSAWAEDVDFLDDDFYEEEGKGEADPFESFNRVSFEFNDLTYTYIFKPVAVGYAEIVPYDIRGTVDNFFYNLEEPVRLVNCLLQGRFEDAATVTGRFIINTLGGIAGLGDPAGRDLGLAPVYATMGETLATWGVGDGPYLVVPLYGPTTARDFTGSVIESLEMTPYYTFTDDYFVLGGIYTGKKTNELSLNLGVYEDIKKLSLDPYIAVRNGYFQYRAKQQHGGFFDKFKDQP